MAAPDKSSQRALEALMARVFKSEFLDLLDKLVKLEAEVKAREAKGLARSEAVGDAVGRAEMILVVLAARGIEAPAEIRDQLLGCTDIEQLDAWGIRAATADSVGEVFGKVNGMP
jgi:hypothetical protein